MSMSEIAAMHGYTYGSESDGTSTYPISITSVTSSDATTPPDSWDAHQWYECVCSNSRAIYDNSIIGHLKYPTIATNANVHGIPSEGKVLPGFIGYECQNYLCSGGDNSFTSRYNSIAGYSYSNGTYTAGKIYSSEGNTFFEEQLVRCTLSTVGTYFQLQFTGNNLLKSLKISIDDNAKAIKRKIELGLKIGNVTVSFPNILTDGFRDKACNPSTDATHGGFLITFIDTIGDLPLLAVADSTQSSYFIITEKRKGNKMNKICSGEAGTCDYKTGLCNCNSDILAASSNGTAAVGARGDCGALLTNLKAN